MKNEPDTSGTAHNLLKLAKANPNLRFYRMGRGSQELFDFQVLLQSLEEKFHFPACLIKVTDGLRIDIKTVG